MPEHRHQAPPPEPAVVDYLEEAAAHKSDAAQERARGEEGEDVENELQGKALQPQAHGASPDDGALDLE